MDEAMDPPMEDMMMDPMMEEAKMDDDMMMMDMEKMEEPPKRRTKEEKLEAFNTMYGILKYQICCLVCVAVPCFAIIILIIEINRRSGNQCGIPVQIWVELVFVIGLVAYLLLLNVLWTVK